MTETATVPVVLGGIDMPPSSNNQYLLIRRGTKTFHVPSAELKKFKNSMLSYFMRKPELVSSQKRVLEWVKAGRLLEVNATFSFHRKSLYTLDGRVKKMDVSNRIKALHDILSKLLGVDDSVFFRVSAEKMVLNDSFPESVSVEILPFISEEPEEEEPDFV